MNNRHRYCFCPCDCGCDREDKINFSKDKFYCNDCLDGRHEIAPSPYMEEKLPYVRSWLLQMEQVNALRHPETVKGNANES